MTYQPKSPSATVTSGAVTSSTTIPFQYSTAPPSYLGTLQGVVTGTTGVLNSRIGIYTYIFTSYLVPNTPVALLLDNSYANTSSTIIVSINSVTPNIFFMNYTITTGVITFNIINGGVVNTPTNWSVSVSFHVLS